MAHRWLAALAFALPCACCAQPATPPAACAAFLGFWSGTWSQGFYGPQRIHITRVSDDCVATLAYSPTEAPPDHARQVPIREGVMAFPCNVPGGTCRIVVEGDVLSFTYQEPSGFVNVGTFRRDP